MSTHVGFSQKNQHTDKVSLCKNQKKIVAMTLVNTTPSSETKKDKKHKLAQKENKKQKIQRIHPSQTPMTKGGRSGHGGARGVGVYHHNF